MTAIDIRQDKADFFDYINQALDNFDASTINDQPNLILFLDLCQRLSWDIPSAIGSFCSHIDLEIPMHRDTSSYPSMDLFHDWAFIDRHFFDLHGLDLTDRHINWSFDT